MKENFKIVLADDDEDEYFFFNEAIESIERTIDLITCINGEKLLRCLQDMESLPDVIFLDINMPLLGGFETLQELRAIDRFKNIPVVMYSTSTNVSDIKKSYNYGANLYLSKVIAMRDLPGKLNSIIDAIVQKKEFELKDYAFPAL